MIIQQATYGEERGGHALLQKSEEGNTAYSDLVGRMDLPGTAPPGIEWETYVSGFPYGKSYVLAKTFIDSGASRGGMVYSHALFLPLEEAGRLNDLHPLMRLLPAEATRSTGLTPISLEAASPPEGPQVDTGGGAGLAALAEALVSSKQRPVVWIGQADFTDSVMVLWNHLPPQVRSTFSFRLSFGPQDCQDEPPTVVCTPGALESRWTGYTIIHPTECPEIRTKAGHLLLGAVEGEGLRTFGVSIQVRIQHLSDLTLLEHCQAYFENQNPTADVTVESVRLLAYLSPNAGEGVPVKREAIRRLANHIPQMAPEHIGSMRNFDLKAFPHEGEVWDAIAAWMTQTARAPTTTSGGTAKLVRRATGASTAWAKALWQGLDAAAKEASQQFAASLWRWWEEDVSLVQLTLPKLPVEPQLETVLVRTCPVSLLPDVGDTVAVASLERGWYRLHGAAVGAAYELAVAVDRQLAVDQDQLSVAGIEVVLSRSSAEEVLACALRLREVRLVSLAAEKCAANPQLLSDLAPEDQTWQQILLGALNENPEAWHGLGNPRSVMYQFVDAALRGEPVALSLVKALAESPLGDLSEYPQRSRVWQGLPRDTSALLVPRTADGWLARFTADTHFDQGIEPDLRRAIAQDATLSRFLTRCAPYHITNGTQLFLQLDILSENQFRSWLTRVAASPSQISTYDSLMLGRVVKDRRWGKAAAEIADYTTKHGRLDFRPALSECCQLLGRFQRVKLRFAGVLQVNEDDVWELFTETAIELYQSGSSEGAIWSRAGGNDAALRHEGTGESGWRHALRLLRHGGGGKISTRKLIEAMREDYPSNDKLRLLSERADFMDHATD